MIGLMAGKVASTLRSPEELLQSLSPIRSGWLKLSEIPSKICRSALRSTVYMFDTHTMLCHRCTREVDFCLDARQIRQMDSTT